MLPLQKIEIIKNKLQSSGSVSIKELEQILGVSRSTVRRYLLQLKNEGFLSINGGCANIIRKTRSDIFQYDYLQWAAQQNNSQINSIAAMAVTLIEENDSIYIGESLVCYLLAKRIKMQPRLKSITVVTNNFNVAVELSSHTKHIYLTGGELLQNAENLYTGGPKFASNLSTIYVTKAFACVDGVDFKAGYTMQNLSQLNILSHLPSFAAKTIFLVASHKFGFRSIHQLAPLDFGDIIITDSGIDEEHLKIFSQMGKPRLVVAG